MKTRNFLFILALGCVFAVPSSIRAFENCPWTDCPTQCNGEISCINPCEDANLEQWNACIKRNKKEYEQNSQQQQQQDQSQTEQGQQQPSSSSSVNSNNTSVPLSRQSNPPPEASKEKTKEKAISFENLKLPTTIAAKKGERTIMTYKDESKVVADSGAHVKVSKDGELTLTSGRIFLSIKKNMSRQFKVRSIGAICAVRGTQFSMEAKGGQTTVKVYEGVVAFSDVNEKNSFEVKTGYQATATAKGVSAPVAFGQTDADRWWEHGNVTQAGSAKKTPVTAKTSASSDLFTASWEQNASATSYVSDCTISAGPLKTLTKLTKDQEKAMDVLNKAFTGYRYRGFGVVNSKDKQARGRVQKTDTLTPTVPYLTGKGTYEAAIDGVKKAGKAAAEFIVLKTDGKIYFAANDVWKVFSDVKTSDQFWTNIAASKITDGLKKSSFKFSQSEEQQSLYEGLADSEKTKQLVTRFFGADFAAQPAGAIQLWINEKTKEWKRMNLLVAVSTATMTMPISEKCSLDFSGNTAVTVPSKAKSLDTKTGLKEFTDLLGSF